MEKTKERNQVFNYLYVLAILMVIDDHCGFVIHFLEGIFPYNSFYMPLFVFISGYFYKKRKNIENIKHKVKRLFIPYIIWNIVALLISAILSHFFKINWIGFESLKGFMFWNLANGPTTTLNGPAWFVLMLFWVSVIYNTIHYKLKDNETIDFISTILYLIIGFIVVELCIRGYSARGGWWLPVLRTLFYIQFYHYGAMFKKYIEKPLSECDKRIVCGICVLVNVILICLFGKIIFNDTFNMRSFRYWFLPLLSSVTGILFYYEVMSFLSSKIGPTKITDFIARNTLIIMEAHLFFINIPSFYMYYMYVKYNYIFEGFMPETFLNTAWYNNFGNSARLIGFFCGLIGSLLVAYMIERVKEKRNNKKLVDNNKVNEELVKSE